MQVTSSANKPLLPQASVSAAAPKATATSQAGGAQAPASLQTIDVFEGAAGTAAATTEVAAVEKKGFLSKVGDFLEKTAGAVQGAVTSAVDGVKQAAGNALTSVKEALYGTKLPDLASDALSTVILGGGKAISGVQRLIGVEPKGRTLTEGELSTVKAVYGDAIDYSKVRVVEGDAGVFSLSGRAFVLGNTIYMPDGMPDAATEQTYPTWNGSDAQWNSYKRETFVHEMGHVWQRQNGGFDYLAEALFAQGHGDAYDYAKGFADGLTFEQLDPEQQAELISSAYGAGYFETGKFVKNGVDYTDYVSRAIELVRSGEGAP